MELWVISSGNEYITHVDNQPSFSYFWGEDCIHHCLECCWRIHQSEEHYSWFKQPLVCDECSFVLVSFFDVYVVVTPSDINFSEHLCVLDSCYEFGNQWQGIMVLNGPFIKASIVLYGLQLAVFLFDEEKWCGVWAL